MVCCEQAYSWGLGSMLSRVRVKTADEWAAAITADIVPLEVLSSARDFNASSSRRDLNDGARITRVRSAAARVHRPASYITSSDDGFIIFHLNLTGQTIVEQHNRSCVLDGLAATLYTTDRPSRFSMSSDHDALLFQFPRHCLPIQSTYFRRALIQPFTPDRMLLRILLAVLEETHTNTNNVQSSDYGMVTSIALQLVTSLVLADEHSLTFKSSQLLLAMQRIIDSEFNNPYLDVTSLARSLRVSERLVYQTFSEAGQSPASVIRTKRLQQAKTLLTSHVDMPVRVVAEHCGFTDFSTFSKAFRREVGCSPTTWRRSASS